MPSTICTSVNLPHILMNDAIIWRKLYNVPVPNIQFQIWAQIKTSAFSVGHLCTTLEYVAGDPLLSDEAFSHLHPKLTPMGFQQTKKSRKLVSWCPLCLGSLDMDCINKETHFVPDAASLATGLTSLGIAVFSSTELQNTNNKSLTCVTCCSICNVTCSS